MKKVNKNKINKDEYKIIQEEYKQLIDNLKFIYDYDGIDSHTRYLFSSLNKMGYSYKFINDIIKKNYDLIKSKIDKGIIYGYFLIKHLIEKELYFDNKDYFIKYGTK
jgi:hypothetical protein